MIEVKRGTKNFICTSCNDRESNTHDVRIGAEDNNKTVISLCEECLDDLYCEIAEALHY